jgi:D-psicose/D-tagatose/L-ribulose 3-epimerase
MAVRFGTYFAYWEQEWDADYPLYCGKAASLGFDILEIAAASLADATDRKLAELKEAASRNGIGLTACIGLPKQYDVSSADNGVRRAGLEYLRRIIAGMEKAGIHALGGITYAYWPYDYSVPVSKAGAWERSVRSVRETADFAAAHGVTLMLEVVNRFEQYLINDAREAVDFVLQADRPNVKIMLDCFHMNIEEDNMGDAIRLAGNLLGHFHIGECNRKVPGKGRMPWKEMGEALRQIGYDGAVVMEPFVRMGGTVGNNIKVWRDLSGGADNAKLDRDIAGALQFVKTAFA